jgi:hypothetical protein
MSNLKILLGALSGRASRFFACPIYNRHESDSYLNANLNQQDAVTDPSLSHTPRSDPQSKWGTTGRALLPALGIGIVLIATNYAALTNDVFRTWAVRQLPSRAIDANSLAAPNEHLLLARAIMREAALKAENEVLKRNVAALTVDAAGLRSANASLLATEKRRVRSTAGR